MPSWCPGWPGALMFSHVACQAPAPQVPGRWRALPSDLWRTEQLALGAQPYHVIWVPIAARILDFHSVELKSPV